MALRITDRSYRYAWPYSGNPSSLRESDSSASVYNLPTHAPTTFSHYVSSQLSPSITPCLFHSWLTTYLFRKPFPPWTPFRPQDFINDRFFWERRFLFFLVSSLLFFRLVLCGRLSWLFVSFWVHINIPCSTSIISYRNILNQSYSIWRLTPITTSNAQTSDPTWPASFGQLIIRKIIKNCCHQM